MTTRLALRERHALCDLALELGPGAPTLCGEWDAGHLVAHLFVREQRPLAAAGVMVPPLAGLTDRAMEKALAGGFGPLVEKVRRPRLTPFALPPLDVLANTLEYLVHHEDLRRAQDAWEPRDLTRADLDTIWGSVGRMGRMLVRKAGVPVEIQRTDTGDTTRLRGHGEGARLTGPVVDVVLWLFGRDQVRDLRFTGPDDAVAALRGTARSF